MCISHSGFVDWNGLLDYWNGPLDYRTSGLNQTSFIQCRTEAQHTYSLSYFAKTALKPAEASFLKCQFSRVYLTVSINRRCI